MCDEGNLVVVNYLRGCGIKCTILLQIILKMLFLCCAKNNFFNAFLLFLLALSQHLINSVPIALLTSTMILMHKQ